MNPFTPAAHDMIVYNVAPSGKAEIFGIAQNREELAFLIGLVPDKADTDTVFDAYSLWGEKTLGELIVAYRARVFRPGTFYFYRELMHELDFYLKPHPNGRVDLNTKQGKVAEIDGSERENQQHAVLLAAAPELYRALSTLVASHSRGFEAEAQARQTANQLLSDLREALMIELP